MHTLTRTAFAATLVLSVLIGLLPAQTQTVVSPVQAATTEGSTQNAFPFASPTSRRYMQLHGDLTTNPMAVNRLSWRANGGGTSGTTPWTFDMELFMGLARDWRPVKYEFDAQYMIPKTAVVARRNVNMGPYVAGSSPNPFSMDVALDAPWPYPGAFSLVWEAVLHSVTSGSGYSLDAEVSTSLSSISVVTGPGCTAFGQIAPATHQLQLADMGGTLAFGMSAINVPPNSLALWALGVQNLNTPVPGLCGSIYTDLAILLPLGLTRADGKIGVDATATALNPGGVSAFTLPNLFPSATLYSQVHVLDPGSSFPIALANTDGRTVTVPTSNLARVVQVTRMFNNVGGSTATGSVFFPTSTVGHGIVTQFSY